MSAGELTRATNEEDNSHKQRSTSNRSCPVLSSDTPPNGDGFPSTNEFVPPSGGSASKGSDPGESSKSLAEDSTNAMEQHSSQHLQQPSEARPASGSGSDLGELLMQHGDIGDWSELVDQAPARDSQSTPPSGGEDRHTGSGPTALRHAAKSDVNSVVEFRAPYYAYVTGIDFTATQLEIFYFFGGTSRISELHCYFENPTPLGSPQARFSGECFMQLNEFRSLIDVLNMDKKELVMRPVSIYHVDPIRFYPRRYSPDRLKRARPAPPLPTEANHLHHYPQRPTSTRYHDGMGTQAAAAKFAQQHGLQDYRGDHPKGRFAESNDARIAVQHQNFMGAARHEFPSQQHGHRNAAQKNSEREVALSQEAERAPVVKPTSASIFCGAKPVDQAKKLQEMEAKMKAEGKKGDSSTPQQPPSSLQHSSSCSVTQLSEHATAGDSHPPSSLTRQSSSSSSTKYYQQGQGPRHHPHHVITQPSPSQHTYTKVLTHGDHHQRGSPHPAATTPATYMPQQRQRQPPATSPPPKEASPSVGPVPLNQCHLQREETVGRKRSADTGVAQLPATAASNQNSSHEGKAWTPIPSADQERAQEHQHFGQKSSLYAAVRQYPHHTQPYHQQYQANYHQGGRPPYQGGKRVGGRPTKSGSREEDAVEERTYERKNSDGGLRQHGKSDEVYTPRGKAPYGQPVGYRGGDSHPVGGYPHRQSERKASEGELKERSPSMEALQPISSGKKFTSKERKHPQIVKASINQVRSIISIDRPDTYSAEKDRPVAGFPHGREGQFKSRRGENPSGREVVGDNGHRSGYTGNRNFVNRTLPKNHRNIGEEGETQGPKKTRPPSYTSFNKYPGSAMRDDMAGKGGERRPSEKLERREKPDFPKLGSVQAMKTVRSDSTPSFSTGSAGDSESTTKRRINLAPRANSAEKGLEVKHSKEQKDDSSKEARSVDNTDYEKKQSGSKSSTKSAKKKASKRGGKDDASGSPVITTANKFTALPSMD